MDFPETIRQFLVALAASDEGDDIGAMTMTPETWANTSMGLGSGLSGQLITGGWIVTLERRRTVQTWHVSTYGHTRMASEVDRP